MLAVLGHELRNPEHIISQSLAFVAEALAATGAAASTDLDAMRQATTSMHGLVDDLVNYTAMRSGALQVRWGAVHLQSLLTAVVASHASLAVVPLTLTIENDAAQYAVTDAMRLRQGAWQGGTAGRWLLALVLTPTHPHTYIHAVQ